MNNKIFTLVFIVFISLSLTQSSSNDCATYFPLVKGTTWTYQDFDKKGKLTSTNTTFVEDVVYSENKTEYKIKSSSLPAKPKKDELPTENQFVYLCENGILKIDMSSLISKEIQESYSDMEVTLEQSEMVIPLALSVGQTLEDASVKITIGSNGMTMMTMTINITNRKIELLEDVTTEAGTYNCALMSYDVNTNMGFMNVKNSTKDWYSNEVGIVKSESYDKNLKLMNSRVLTAYSK